MYSLFTLCLFTLTTLLLTISFIKNKYKTILSLKKSWKIFLKVLPQFIIFFLSAEFFLTLLKPEIIKQSILGSNSSIFGIFISSLVGSISLVPVLIAFPLSSELLNLGVGLVQITIFISTLTTVGLVTIPLEVKYLGKKVAILRNLLAFVFSYFVALVIGMVFI